MMLKLNFALEMEHSIPQNCLFAFIRFNKDGATFLCYK